MSDELAVARRPDTGRLNGPLLPAASSPSLSRESITPSYTAHHEAGHMVLALGQGFRPERATIEPDATRQTLGGIYYAGHDAPPKDDEPYLIPPERWPALEDEMTTILAGPVATAFLTGTAPALQFGWQRDYEQARELAERRGVRRHETGAFLAWIRVRAEYLVELQWPAIKRVAAALVERQTLTRDEALALIREAQEEAA